MLRRQSSAHAGSAGGEHELAAREHFGSFHDLLALLASFESFGGVPLMAVFENRRTRQLGSTSRVVGAEGKVDLRPNGSHRVNIPPLP